MQLTEITRDIEILELTGDAEITGLAYDSRNVKPGDLFFCISGFNSDGHAYASSAVKSGAAAIMVTRKLPLDVPQIIVADDRAAMAEISANFYGNPSKKMRLVGVTGTNGKTTVTYMLKRIFEVGGSRVGLIGTNANMIGSEVIHTERTTPEAPDLNALFAKMSDDGCDTVVMEVSSHALELKRVYGQHFAAGIFTNLTQDHLDFHPSFEHYAAAKKKLFSMCELGIINRDSEWGEYMARGETNVTTYGIEMGADVAAENIRLNADGVRFTLKTSSFKTPLYIPTPAEFTVYNALAAATTALALGADLFDIKSALDEFTGVPGRFEPLDTHGRPFAIIRDYSHTPDSLENCIKSAQKLKAQGEAKRVVCIFGCGGDRDSSKRPIMGKIATEFADFVIVTSDNPRTENPLDIIHQIEAGMSGEYIEIENRREAIKFAIDKAQDGDIILLCGKGHEDYQEIDGVKYDFDEKIIVEELLG